MLKLKKAFKSYRHSGAFNALLAPTAFIADNVFITKTGDVGMVLKVEGIDYECLPDTMLEEQASRFEASIRSFDERFRLYQYVIKRDGATIPTEKRYATISLKKRFEIVWSIYGPRGINSSRWSCTSSCCTNPSAF